MQDMHLGRSYYLGDYCGTKISKPKTITRVLQKQGAAYQEPAIFDHFAIDDYCTALSLPKPDWWLAKSAQQCELAVTRANCLRRTAASVR